MGKGSDETVTNEARAADFEKLESRQDYEQVIRKSIRGVPQHWVPEIAKQCLYAPSSSNGKRWAAPGAALDEARVDCSKAKDSQTAPFAPMTN